MVVGALEKLCALRIPIVAAPMANIAGGKLAGAVSRAGGLGFIGMGHGSKSFLEEELSIGKMEKGDIGIGVGFLAWRLEELDDESAYEILDRVLEDSDVIAVWFSFGRKLQQWVEYCAQNRHLNNSNKVKIFVMVGTGTEIEQVLSWGDKVDVLVIQGSEAGGHGSSKGLPVRDLFKHPALTSQTSNSPILLATGGIGSAEHVRDLLSLPNCEGVVVGTRLAASTESLYGETQKKRLVAAQGIDTSRTTFFDRMRGTLGWPDAIDGRGVRTELMDDLESGKITEEEAIQRYRADAANGVAWAGTGVSDVKKIQGVGEILRELYPHQNI